MAENKNALNELEKEAIQLVLAEHIEHRIRIHNEGPLAEELKTLFMELSIDPAEEHEKENHFLHEALDRIQAIDSLDDVFHFLEFIDENPLNIDQWGQIIDPRAGFVFSEPDPEPEEELAFVTYLADAYALDPAIVNELLDQVKPNIPPSECPNCHQSNIARIVYGYPSSSLREKANQGRVTLGGCTIRMGGKNPKWHCNSCLHRW